MHSLYVYQCIFWVHDSIRSSSASWLFASVTCLFVVATRDSDTANSEWPWYWFNLGNMIPVIVYQFLKWNFANSYTGVLHYPFVLHLFSFEKIHEIQFLSPTLPNPDAPNPFTNSSKDPWGQSTDATSRTRNCQEDKDQSNQNHQRRVLGRPRSISHQR